MAALIFGGPPVSRTRYQRIMLTNYGFRRPFRVCGLDCLLSLRPVRTVSTRSLLTRASLGIATMIAHQRFPRI